MKAILLTKNIENLAIKYSNNLFVDRRQNFQRPVIMLNAMADSLYRKRKLNRDYYNYVKTVIRLYPYLNKIKPDRFEKLNAKFFLKYRGTVSLKKVIDIGGHKKKFYKHITEAMRYDAVRDKDFLPYAKKLGINSCIYCNANYALSLDTSAGQIGKYELDHCFAQSSYPYLCTNFYNLYPVCANCNKAKSDIKASFRLYTTDPANMYPFSFSLDKKSIVKYMLSQNFEDLKILFNPHHHLDHNNIFKIEATYSALKDVAEDLIWKHKIYNASYLNSLRSAFKKKFDYSSYNQFIIGNYDKPNDIHKRPLAKLTQDLAKQLGIIK